MKQQHRRPTLILVTAAAAALSILTTSTSTGQASAFSIDSPLTPISSTSRHRQIRTLTLLSSSVSQPFSNDKDESDPSIVKSQWPSFSRFLRLPRSCPADPTRRRITRSLYAFYTMAGSCVSWSVARGNLPAAYAQTVVATAWMSFILAISGMEAWVKFRAPFCPKAYKLDVGRLVFGALNAVEGALCTTLWMLHAAAVRAMASGAEWNIGVWPLFIATGILMLDVFYLTPKLDRQGQRIVKAYHESNIAGTQQSGIAEKGDDAIATGNESSGKSVHLVYVALEMTKLFTLAICLRSWFPMYVLHSIAPFPR